MPQIPVYFYHHKTKFGVYAVSPVANGLLFPNSDEWELERQQNIEITGVLPGTEIATWIEAFKRQGYCLLGKNPKSGTYFTETEVADPKSPKQ
jgi:hypothetical protein